MKNESSLLKASLGFISPLFFLLIKSPFLKAPALQKTVLFTSSFPKQQFSCPPDDDTRILPIEIAVFCATSAKVLQIKFEVAPTVSFTPPVQVEATKSLQ